MWIELRLLVIHRGVGRHSDRFLPFFLLFRNLTLRCPESLKNAQPVLRLGGGFFLFESGNQSLVLAGLHVRFDPRVDRLRFPLDCLPRVGLRGILALTVQVLLDVVFYLVQSTLVLGGRVGLEGRLRLFGLHLQPLLGRPARAGDVRVVLVLLQDLPGHVVAETHVRVLLVDPGNLLFWSTAYL